MTAVLADLAVESEAATWHRARLARRYDADAGAGDPGLRRLATAVAKYWVCKRGPHHAYEAMECLGGNGYTEGFPLARRYREQPVMAIWEGSGNVIALDVLRTLAREPDAFAAYDAELSLARGQHRDLDTHLDRLRVQAQALVGADPVVAQGGLRAGRGHGVGTAGLAAHPDGAGSCERRLRGRTTRARSRVAVRRSTDARSRVAGILARH